MGSATATGARRRRSRSTSTISATWCTAISSSRCSTPITTSAAFCRSTSMRREAADAIAVQRALSGKDKLRGFKAFRYGAKSWDKERRFVARIEVTPKGLDVRYVVTSLKAGARHLYETLYCARGNAENFIKLHKSQLASDRTSCRDPKANQFRLILHTAAYWLMLAMRSAVPARSQLSHAEFATMRLRLIKIAARVVEGAARIRVYLPTACPDRDVFRALAGRFCAAGP